MPDNSKKPIKILWWNVNRRLDFITKRHSPIKIYIPHILFLLETAVGHDIIPNIQDYIKIADKNKKVSNHGGIVAYLHNSIASHVFNITYGSCYTSLRLDFIPGYIFIGAYIQPASSNHFDTNMFGELSSILLDSNERGLIPIMGGDINCRFGNMNHAFREQHLSYQENVDKTTNSNGITYGIDVCNSGKVFPINHLKLGKRTFPGDHTYHKAGKKSQIDFVFTNRAGTKDIIDFVIPNENWHLSDHRPIYLEIKAKESINCSALLRRAKDLNYEFDPQHTKPTRYLGTYNDVIFQESLRNIFPLIEKEVMNELKKENINGAICKIDDHIATAYRNAKVKQNSTKQVKCNKMNNANDNFDNLRKCLSGEIVGDKDELLNIYQESRNLLNKDILLEEKKKWDNLISSNDSKGMWKKINWKGNVTKCTQAPVFEELTAHFEDLYKTPVNEIEKMEKLTTNVYVQSLDKPIERKEIDEAIKEMKNGGYDHRINKFRIITKILYPLLPMLLNIMFFITYPAKLAISLLNAIPKKGDLSLPKNFRGIQMLPGMGVLYDRIINNRLKVWIRNIIHDVQTAYQKGKSTLHHIFTIRLLIEIANLKNITLYIGMFDLEKAFDRVSRFKMLQKLITLGIGNAMLQALKRIYTCTYCILCLGREFSKKFRTFTGIRQGAASSALIFIAFINDLINYLEEKCDPEPFLRDLHCLLHADDTAILSTSREMFIIKCNHLLNYFCENSLTLNLSKSGYLIINGKENDHKCCVILQNGMLEYKSELKYLGIVITDKGKIRHDVEEYINSKRSEITIKYGNFCRKNFLAPLDTKIDVLNVCVAASIVYACETWGNCPKSIESMYREGLKTALSIRQGTNNEIVYLESGQWPLEVRVTKLQLKFWLHIRKIMDDNPDSYIARLVRLGENTDYMKHYRKLERDFVDPETCHSSLTSTFRNTFTEKIEEAARLDEDSRLGTYITVNPTLSKPAYENVFEFQRVLITRYRTGSHNLRVEKDRQIPNSNREDRLCKCNNEVQTLKHILMSCPLLNEIRDKYGVVDVVNGVFNDGFLLEMECILDIK